MAARVIVNDSKQQNRNIIGVTISIAMHSAAVVETGLKTCNSFLASLAPVLQPPQVHHYAACKTLLSAFDV